MNVVFCWWTFEGYFGACWRALAARPGMSVTILALRPGDAAPGEGTTLPFPESVLHGLRAELLDRREMLDAGSLIQRLRAARPDAVVTPGWVNPAAVRAVQHGSLRDAAIVVTSDRPYTGTLRQRLGRLAYRRYFARADRIVVAGTRAARLARALGFPESRIATGMYGYDSAAVAGCLAERPAAGWPRRFLYVGRYIEHKGVGVLARAYEQYRGRVRDPWPLECCGAGPMRPQLAGPGVDDMGFVAPGALRGALLRAGTLVLPSLHEPWGMALVEAMAAGLPVVCTDACGAGADLVTDAVQGRVVPAGDIAALASALEWIHERYGELAAMGKRAEAAAAGHADLRWAERWDALLHHAVRERRT